MEVSSTAMRREASNDCLVRCNTVMPGPVPGIHVFLAIGCQRRGWPGHRRAEATPSFGRLCPAMTTEISRLAIAMLRPMPKHAIVKSNHDFGWIVEEALAEDLLATPFLQAHFVEPAHLAGSVGQFENPVNRDLVAFDHRGDRLGT